jgi:hypothetical protein
VVIFVKVWIRQPSFFLGHPQKSSDKGELATRSFVAFKRVRFQLIIATLNRSRRHPLGG